MGASAYDHHAHSRTQGRAVQVNPKDVLHRGLNVRMAIASGTAANIQQNAVSKRNEYQGEVLDLVHSLMDIPNGGMLLLDGKTFSGISTSLVDIAKILPAQPDLSHNRSSA